MSQAPESPGECWMRLLTRHDDDSTQGESGDALSILRFLYTSHAATLSDAQWATLTRSVALPSINAVIESSDEEEDAPPSAQKPSSRKRSAGTPLLSPAKRRAITPEPEPNVDGDLDLDEILLDIASSQTSEQALVPTTTNNNRRAERKREQKKKAKAIEKKISIGLQKPQETAELAAWETISSEHETALAWTVGQIAKEDEEDSSDSNVQALPSYITATTMHKNALRLGNTTAQHNAVCFLNHWRRCGTPFSSNAPIIRSPSDGKPTSSKRGLFPWSQSQANKANDAFCFAWNAINAAQDNAAIANVQYRWAMAFLGRAYANEINRLEQEDGDNISARKHRRQGKGNLRTEAINSLLPLVYPNPQGSQRAAFKNRLQKATRWHDLVCELGLGLALLIPHDQVSNTWVDTTLKVKEFQVWLQAIKKFNPEVYAASQAFQSWLGTSSIEGGSLEGKERLYLEIAFKDKIIDETSSENDDVPGQLEELVDMDITARQSQAGARVDRQLTLSDLFKPREQISFSPASSSCS